MAVRTRRMLSLEHFAKKVGEIPEEMEGAVIRGLRSAAHHGVGEVVRSIATTSPHPAIDTGALGRSVEAIDTPRGGDIIVDAPHAAPIENGSRPFWPPLQPLIDWSMRKFGVSEKEAEGIARAVQRKIAEEGIEPRHYFRRAMRRVRKIVPIEVESELKKL